MEVQLESDDRSGYSLRFTVLHVFGTAFSHQIPKEPSNIPPRHCDQRLILDSKYLSTISRLHLSYLRFFYPSIGNRNI